MTIASDSAYSSFKGTWVYSGQDRFGVRVWYIIRLNPRAWARFAIWRPIFPSPIRPSWGLVTGSDDYGK